MLEDVSETGLNLARVLDAAAQAHVSAAERARTERNDALWRAQIDAAYERAAAAAALVACHYDAEPERTEFHIGAARIAMLAGFLKRAEDLIAAARTGRSPDGYAATIAEMVFEIRRDRAKSVSVDDAGRELA